MISLALTTYNRYELLKQAFEQVITCPAVDDIVILDDHSKLDIYKLVDALHDVSPKIRVIRQAHNRGMQQNKRDAIALSKHEWVIIFDSDNVIKEDYLQALPPNPDPDTIYLPSFAWPNFNYEALAGMTFDRTNIKDAFKFQNGEACFNTCNYFVHRDTYLSVYEHNPKMKGTDTIWFAYLWLKAGKKFQVLPGLHYYHRVHSGSGFMEHVNYNMEQSARIKKMILEL